MHLTVRPLQGWVGDRTPAAARKRHAFTRQQVKRDREGRSYKSYDREPMPWSDTLLILDRELTALAASSVVLQIDVPERDIRIDGQLRASARPADPAVRLLFDSRHGALSYQCDQFATWQDNGRAIALGLEALRKVERYGITTHGEQYKGWLQIEAGPAGVSPRDVLVAVIGGPYADLVPLTDRELLRRARAIAHPDRNGGHRGLWDDVERAAQALGLA